MNNNIILPEQPFIPLGPFKLRLPGIHYRVEMSEFLQGLLIGATALSAIPYLTTYLGIPYELAWSCVILEVFLYMLHASLGDPVVPGWISPTLPLTIAYLTQFEIGKERIQALIALQLMVGLIFLILGITKWAESVVTKIPTSIKAGILLATPITVIQTQLSPGSELNMYPIAVMVGFLSLAVISFSPIYNKYRKKSKILDTIAQYGNLFPYLLAMLVGILVKELAAPVVEMGTIIKIPDIKGVISTVSVFGVGFPPLELFIKAFPLAIVCYIIAFGDFVTSESLVKQAQKTRKDEHIDFDSSRSNIVSGMRNIILAILAPFPPLSGPLWVGMTVSVTTRYSQGKEAMQSLIGGMASFRLGTLLSVVLIPVVTFMQPIFPVGAGVTLMFQAFICGRLGMEYCKSDLDRSIAIMMAVVLATKGSAIGLLTGILLNIILGNMKKPETSEVAC